MNMFKPAKAKSIKEYFDLMPKERKELMLFLDKFIKKAAPKLEPHFAANMLGYGYFPYKNSKTKKVLQWHTIGLASQKNYVSLYVCAMDGKQYVAEKHAKELGKVTVGKSCISFKKLEDINLPVLKKVIQQAAKKPGFNI